MKSIKYSLLFFAAIFLTHIIVHAQNVVDSDLSNNAGTNKNFSEQWWLFGIIGLIVLVILVAYSRKKRRKI
ncbi:MAG TPA: LPXTG cell wall anchor domain-containing protein [Sphingobacteriaceae bacterium]|nr:LPXTG cell wall anchor domain-containing protein [Sphingobacteriaceae bacterium]